MRGLGRLAVMLMVCLPAVRAQVPEPRFEVATVRPSAPESTRLNFRLSSATFIAVHASMLDMIRFAFHTRSDNQIVGLESWMSKEYFDVNGKVDEATVAALAKLPPEDHFDAMRTMMRGLLAERFGLKVTTSRQELPVYELEVAKGGSKLTPTKVPGLAADGTRAGTTGIGYTGAHQLTASSVPVGMLVDWLAREPEIGNRTVVDRTGLTGKFDFVLNGIPRGNAEEDPGAASLFTVLPEQLGLVLRPAKALTDVYTIEAAHRPSEN